MANFFIEQQLGAVAREQGTSVRSLRSRIREVTSGLTLATACSGTDSPIVLAKCLGLESSFSCEFDKLKQEWIMANFPEVQRLFCDIKTLRRNEVLNLITGAKERVPSADIFITGFVCKSVSTENNDRKAYKNCIKEGSGETGETFSGMMDYIKKHTPLVVIAENVKGITTKNDGNPPVILQVVDAMKKAGYHFDYKLLNTSDFIIPQSRNRCWMVGLRRDQFSECDVEEIFDMVEQMKSPAMDLKKYFKHFKVGRMGMPPKQTLNARQRRVIKAGLKKAKQRSPRDQVIVDVAKSDKRAPTQLNRTPCLVANSTPFWHNQNRFLSAEEVLALQGIFAKDFKAAKKTFLTKHRRLCHDLTGNAFSMSVCSAVLSSVLLKLCDV
ncbi:unnamed protein product [Durusdinium trenchii]|uniref:Modification methylase HaeII (M.HaeII) (Cytosine-specific methyltransferase HaeII) n=2 Tax=Durusdinium trenchii TaxID=1381693 RepID=A0ABP0HEB3_9DINO